MNREVRHSLASFPPPRLLQKLIEWGIDLNNYNNDHVTPIMLAAKQGDREIVEALLEGNADPSYENEKVPYLPPTHVDACCLSCYRLSTS